MLQLINPKVGPVGGIRFVDPDTQFAYDRLYRNFEELEAHVTQHRDQNKLPPIEDFRRVWENWICNEPGMEGKCCPVSADIERSFEQYVAGAKAFVRRAFSKNKLASAIDAEKRAARCADCTQNLANIGHRMSQFYTDKFMLHQTGGKRTSLDSRLYTCKICTCLLRSKVHYPAKEVAASLSDTEVGRLSREPKSISTGQPLRCWQLDCVDEVRDSEK